MALGLSIIGLIMAAVVVSVGQIWLLQENLQDALNNAVATMEASSSQSSADLAPLVEADGSIASVSVSAFSESQGEIQATVDAPVQLWFWASWMGTAPVQIMAAT